MCCGEARFVESGRAKSDSAATQGNSEACSGDCGLGSIDYRKERLCRDGLLDPARRGDTTREEARVSEKSWRVNWNDAKGNASAYNLLSTRSFPVLAGDL